MRLTDITIKSLRAPKHGARIYTDHVLPGFGVRVSQGGTKSFVLTHGPRHQRETIGRVGVVGLKEARDEAKRRLAEYTLGKSKPRSIGWNAALEEYLTEKAARLKPRTLADYTYELNRHFRYGSTKFCDLSPHDLWKSLDRLVKTPAEQQHAFVTLRAFMRWAHRKHYVDRNPMERMQAPHRYIPRDRILTDEELKRVWHAAGDDVFGKLVKLLILTGQRVGEIRQLTHGMIGEDRITLPSWLAKNSREHIFPLGAAAKLILPTEVEGMFLLPARGSDGRKPFNGIATAKPKLDKRCGVSGWVLHDLRRTFASGLASIGIQLPVIERLLNHVSGSFGGIVGVYQRYDFMPEMRDAIARWERRVEEITSDGTGSGKEGDPEKPFSLPRHPERGLHRAA